MTDNRETLCTNTWYDVRYRKPFKNREVLVKFNDGLFGTARWCGWAWVGQAGLEITTHNVTHFYMYEKFNEVNVEQ
jgi:hypothetical protein